MMSALLAQASDGVLANPTLVHYLFVSTIMFSIGVIGFLSRRNMIIMFLCT